MTRLASWVVAVAVGMGLAGSGWAMFALPQQTPVDRLIKNIGAYIQEHPKDAQAYYTLARVHYLAYVLKAEAVGTFGQGEDANAMPSVASDMFQRMGRGRGPDEEPDRPKVPADVLKQHVTEAVANFQKAIEREPKRALFHLGLAGILEQGAEMAPRIGWPAKSFEQPPPSEEKAKAVEELIARLGDKDSSRRESAYAQLRKDIAGSMNVLLKHRQEKDIEAQHRVDQLIADYWKEQAIGTYLAAYKLAIADDLKIRARPIHGLSSLVGYEAGKAYVRLAQARGATEGEKEQIAQVEKDLQTLDQKPMGAITPIIFAVDRPAALDDLLAPARTVNFDLDGTGRGLRWPWVKPTTGILVWDPGHTGRITSGRQLFGSVTWWIFWDNGYRALDALDDDRDGRLTGEELKGLGVWFDRNGNGVSDPGEVTPIEQVGITSLSVRPTGAVGESPACSHGLVLQGGRILPTYDWVAEPARNPGPSVGRPRATSP